MVDQVVVDALDAVVSRAKHGQGATVGGRVVQAMEAVKDLSLLGWREGHSAQLSEGVETCPEEV